MLTNRFKGYSRALLRSTILFSLAIPHGEALADFSGFAEEIKTDIMANQKKIRSGMRGFFKDVVKGYCTDDSSHCMGDDGKFTSGDLNPGAVSEFIDQQYIAALNAGRKQQTNLLVTLHFCTLADGSEEKSEDCKKAIAGAVLSASKNEMLKEPLENFLSTRTAGVEDPTEGFIKFLSGQWDNLKGNWNDLKTNNSSKLATSIDRDIIDAINDIPSKDITGSTFTGFDGTSYLNAIDKHNSVELNHLEMVSEGNSGNYIKIKDGVEISNPELEPAIRKRILKYNQAWEAASSVGFAIDKFTSKKNINTLKIELKNFYATSYGYLYDKSEEVKDLIDEISSIISTESHDKVGHLIDETSYPFTTESGADETCYPSKFDLSNIETKLQNFLTKLSKDLKDIEEDIDGDIKAAKKAAEEAAAKIKAINENIKKYYLSSEEVGEFPKNILQLLIPSNVLLDSCDPALTPKLIEGVRKVIMDYIKYTPEDINNRAVFNSTINSLDPEGMGQKLKKKIDEIAGTSPPISEKIHDCTSQLKLDIRACAKEITFSAECQANADLRNNKTNLKPEIKEVLDHAWEEFLGT